MVGVSLLLMLLIVESISAFVPHHPRALSLRRNQNNQFSSNKFDVEEVAWYNKKPKGFGMTIGEAMAGGLVIEFFLFYMHYGVHWW